MKKPEEDMPNGFISANMLQATGILQEINRLFWHPIGLHMEPQGEDKFAICDYRDDEEGCALRYVNADYIQQVKALFGFRRETRKDQLGWIVQPAGALSQTVKDKGSVLWIPKV